MYGKREHLERLPGINHYFLQDHVPYKFQPGNVNYELTYSLLGLWDYLRGFSLAHQRFELADDRPGQLAFAFEAIAGHEEALAAPLIDLLASRPNVRIIGLPTAERSRRMPTISFVVDGMTSDEVTLAVDRHKIGIRYGDFYAARLVDDLGLRGKNGVVRASFVHYNTVEEVNRLVEALDGTI
jgi:selenocysteine lyase/cysteine desulfurase